MKPYVEIEGTRVYLPQSVDPHKYEVCIMKNEATDFYLLCLKVSRRFIQATGVLLERAGNELIFHKSGMYFIQRTFPLNKSEFKTIQIDWQASSGPISIVHED
ncbi:MAG: hypothetical protein M3R17_08450 [Bacteroidota bacterium]|nr:hypothetical protein [Bacteroidota bacterium]